MDVLGRPWALRLRNVLRQNSLARALYSRWMASHAYEERFRERLLGGVDGASTTVWDIGANVGLYTQQILERGAGHVVAFEPAPDAIQELRRRFEGATAASQRVTIVPVALSDTCATVHFSADGSSALNRIMDENTAPAHNGGNSVEVSVLRADVALKTYGIPAPNVVKIDVEGFELEVLRGFGELLSQPQLRLILIEVHFALLKERGFESAPTEIVALLARHGFKTEWLDLSHVCGTRVSQ